MTRQENATAQNSTKEIRPSSPNPPKGWQKFKWYGPGLIWMISSVGSGSVLFTPRIGSKYQYELMWIALIVIFLMWVMIREIGRYTVVTGKSIFDGFRELPGPTGWAIWLIFIPQLLAAVVTIAGIASLAGSALMIALPGSQAVYAVGLIVTSILLVVSGKYKWVERSTSVLAGILVVMVVVTAARVFPSFSKFSSGLVPGIPSDFDINFVMPWIGFILAGAAGILWFSYWVLAREYGGSSTAVSESTDKTPRDPQSKEVQQKLRKWLKIMSTTAVIGVVGGGLVILAFLTLGAELLAPEGIVPKGIGVAKDLTKLLSEVWGPAGYWILIVAIFIALSGTVLANQDGWGRMFADATLILLVPFLKRKNKIKTVPDTQEIKVVSSLPSFQKKLVSLLEDRKRLRNIYAIVFCAVLPVIVFFIVRKPVEILSLAGVVAAAHTPFVVFLTLYLNRKKLPKSLAPGWATSAVMIMAGLFFTGFAVYHLLSL